MAGLAAELGRPARPDGCGSSLDHHERNHQGLGNELIDSAPQSSPEPALDEVIYDEAWEELRFYRRAARPWADASCGIAIHTSVPSR